MYITLTIQTLDASHVNRILSQLQTTWSQGNDVLGVQQTLGALQLIHIVEGHALAVEFRLVCTKRLTLRLKKAINQSIASMCSILKRFRS